ncbi:ABC transporter substrate-binding protein [Streptococcus sp. zg-JUN1979]|uniref:ABC transporter substrate-binding protein n=1 Tax=Streptococcus sp. zg-JUN1979 TaxID=3391450 RepID=UPI0039A756ED
MKKKLAFIAVAFISTVLLAACSSPPSVSSSAEGTKIGDTFKLGMNFELTGSVSAYGSAEKKGAMMAVEEINKAGGIDGKKIEVISKDNKSDNSESATVATSLTTQEKVNAIVGPATSGAVASSSPSSQLYGVPMVTPSGTMDSLTVTKKGETKEYVFRTTFIDSYQGQVLAKFATDDLNAQKVVLYYDNSSDYGKGIAKEFKKHYQGNIVSEQTFQSGDTDFQSALTNISKLDFDAIIMPGYYNETGTIIKQARELGIAQTIAGSDGFADAKLIELAGSKNATNVYYISGFSAKSSPKAEAFAKAYADKYGEEASMFAALGYDSVYMIADAAKGADDSKDVAKALATLKDFDGVTGKMTMNTKHNPVKSVPVIGLTDGQESSSVIVNPD